MLCLFPKSEKQGQIFGMYWGAKQILNARTEAAEQSISQKDSPVDIRELISTLRKRILSLKSEFIEVEGNEMKVNYAEMTKSEAFHSFVDYAKKLDSIDLTLLNETELKSFFLNLYNVLSLHAFSLRSDRSTMTIMDKINLFALASYQVGPFVLSLNDIEHGILRCNRPAPILFQSTQFRGSSVETDSRLRLSLLLDPRIHFAINCGSKSCPPISVFNDDDVLLNQQLNLAARSFIANDVEIYEEKRTIRLSKLFYYYKDDFGPSDYDRILWIFEHADEVVRLKLGKFMDTSKKQIHCGITYTNWDWGSNSH